MGIHYKLEIEFLKEVEDGENETNRKELLSEEQLTKIIEKYPHAPQDYIAYLKIIGSGNIRECRFKVQPFLFTLKDLGLDQYYAIKSNIVFFGDNFSGDFSGFDLDLNDGLIVEFWHESGDLHYTQQTFQNYIRQQIGMNEMGTI